MHSIEIPGRINGEGHLELEASFDVKEKDVKVIILFDEGEDEYESEWSKAVSSNPAFDFLKDKAEDIYTVKDGTPFHDEE